MGCYVLPWKQCFIQKGDTASPNFKSFALICLSLSFRKVCMPVWATPVECQELL